MDDLTAITTATAHPCLDCGAPAGQVCADQCPSAVAVELEAEASYDAPCCPSPAAAARALCGCQGLAAGTWIGSAA